MTRRTVLLVALGFGCFFQQSVLFPVLPRFALEVTDVLTVVGVVLGARFLVPAFVASQIGSWVTSFGVRRALIASGSAMIGGAAAYIFADTVVALVVVQVVNGVLYVVAWISAQTLATRMPNRDVVVSAFATMTALGMAVGPIVGGIALDLGGYVTAFAVYGAGGAALALNAWLLGGEPAVRRPLPTRMAGLASIRRLLTRPAYAATLVFSSLCLVTISLRGNIVPVLLDERAFSASLIGLVLGAGSLGQAVVRPFTVAILRHLPLRVSMVAAASLAIVGLAWLTVSNGIMSLVAIAFLHGTGAGLHQSLGLSVAAAVTTDEERGVAIGLRATVGQLSIAIAPMAAGALAVMTGVGQSLHILSIVLLVATWWLWRLLDRMEAATTR